MVYTLIAAVIAALDQRMKSRVEKTGKLQERKPVWKGRLILSRYHNYGAFLNLGEKNSLLMRALSLALTVFMTVLFVGSLTFKGSATLKTGLSLLLGGAFSNTYDRLKRKYVVDYFSFHTGIAALDRVVFNLADFAIMIGALCIAFGA